MTAPPVNPEMLWALFTSRTNVTAATRQADDHARMQGFYSRMMGASDEDKGDMLTTFIDFENELKHQRIQEDRTEIHMLHDATLKYFDVVIQTRPLVPQVYGHPARMVQSSASSVANGATPQVNTSAPVSHGPGLRANVVQSPGAPVARACPTQVNAATPANSTQGGQASTRRSTTRASRARGGASATSPVNNVTLDPLRAMSINQVPPGATVVKDKGKIIALQCCVCDRYMDSAAGMFYHLNQNDLAHRTLLGDNGTFKRAVLLCGRELIDADDDSMNAHNVARELAGRR